MITSPSPTSTTSSSPLTQERENSGGFTQQLASMRRKIEGHKQSIEQMNQQLKTVKEQKRKMENEFNDRTTALQTELEITQRTNIKLTGDVIHLRNEEKEN